MTQFLTGHLRLLAPAFIDTAPHDILALDLGNNVFEGEFPQCFAPRTLKFLQLSNNSSEIRTPNIHWSEHRELVLLEIKMSHVPMRSFVVDRF